MPTSTFDRKIVIADVERLIGFIDQNGSEKPLSESPYTEEDRKLSVLLLKRCLSNSRQTQSGFSEEDTNGH